MGRLVPVQEVVPLPALEEKEGRVLADGNGKGLKEFVIGEGFPL